MRSRRQFVKNAASGLGVLSLSNLLQASVETGKIEKKKIVCVGGHPDDPESGCGGTLAKMVKNGHAVTIIYLTTGEAGVKGKSNDEAALILDITDTQELKRRAIYCHQSQDPPGIYNCGHAAMEDFRGRELGVKAAEAFIRITKAGNLL